MTANPRRGGFRRVLAWVLVALFAVLTLRYLFEVVADFSDGGSWFALVCFCVATVGSTVLAGTYTRQDSPK